jgi:hypothetical protein
LQRGLSAAGGYGSGVATSLASPFRNSHSFVATSDEASFGIKGAAESHCTCQSPADDQGHDVTFAPAMRRTALWEALCLSCGTSLERIAPESLTRRLSEFVHGDMSWAPSGVPPHRVNGIGSPVATKSQFVNASIAGRNSRLSDGTARPRARPVTACVQWPWPAVERRRTVSPA